MPVSESKKSVQAYVSADTKAKIAKLAKSQKRTESFIVGEILEKALNQK